MRAAAARALATVALPGDLRAGESLAALAASDPDGGVRHAAAAAADTLARRGERLLPPARAAAAIADGRGRAAPLQRLELAAKLG